MKDICTNVEVTISTGDLHYMEDFVAEFTAPSVVEQALEGVEHNDLEQAYLNFIIQEYLRESILRGRSCEV